MAGALKAALEELGVRLHVVDTEPGVRPHGPCTLPAELSSLWAVWRLGGGPQMQSWERFIEDVARKGARRVNRS